MSADAVGGVWTHSLDLTRALRAHGVEVVLATQGPAPSEAQRGDARAAGVAALHESELRLEWMEEPWDDVEAAGEWLRELADEEEVDLVHLNSYALGAVDWGPPALVAGHSCVCSWWRAVEGGEAPPEWDRYRAAVAAGLAGADVVVAPTRAMLAALEELYGVRGGRVVHNGSSARACAELKEPLVAAAGRLWDRAKNLELLDRAARDLPWPLLVAGEGGPRAAASASGPRLLGHLARPRLEALLARAAIFAHPARYEPFGLAPVEAARGGCALVLGDIASLREVWGDAALYADPNDPAALRGALMRLIEDEPLRVELADRARRRAARYTTERMGAAYAGLYAGAAARAGAPA